MVRFENVLKISLQNVLKMSWRHLEDVLKTSWRRLEDVLKTYGQDKYIGLDQDVFWRRKAKANIFVLIKTSWRRLEDILWRRRWKMSSRRLHQDECLLGIYYNNIIIEIWIKCHFFNPAFCLSVTAQTFATNRNNQET